MRSANASPPPADAACGQLRHAPAIAQALHTHESRFQNSGDSMRHPSSAPSGLHSALARRGLARRAVLLAALIAGVAGCNNAAAPPADSAAEPTPAPVAAP